MRRAAVLLVAIASAGCAGWVEQDELWFDDPGSDVTPALAYGFAAPEEPGRDVADSPVVDDEPTPAAIEDTSFRTRTPFVTHCRWIVVEGVVDPMLEADAIRRTVQRHENDIRVCYNHALRRDRDAAGRVVMTFAIASDGSVPAAVVESSAIDDPQLQRCLSTTIRRWSFPVPPGARVSLVHYPFVFAQAQRMPLDVGDAIPR